MQNYVITVARGFGSGGKEISSLLGERLGIPFYDKEILDMASDIYGIDKNDFEQVDEKLRQGIFSKILRRGKKNYIAQPEDEDFISDDVLFHLQMQIIRHLEETQSCIIIGKCADFVLRDYTNVISVYIEAPRRYCLRSVKGKLNVTDSKAAKMIEKTDKYRAEYYKYYTGGNYWTNPVNYDLTLNSERVGRERCVDIIENYVKMKFFQ